jgi:hypothetical protein
VEIVELPDFGLSRCPVCGTREPDPAVAVPMAWTVADDGSASAVYVHVKCMDPVMFKDQAGGKRGVILAQSFQAED